MMDGDRGTILSRVEGNVQRLCEGLVIDEYSALTKLTWNHSKNPRAQSKGIHVEITLYPLVAATLKRVVGWYFYRG